MIEESYVSFETAKLLKEAGFREPCISHYSSTGQVWQSSFPEDYNDDKSCRACSRPTQSFAAEWLRETHKIYVILNPSIDGWMYDLYDLKKYQYILCSKDAGDVAYEAAFEEALQQALTLIHGCPKHEPINPASCTYK